MSDNNDLVYRQIIDNKLALKKLATFEKKLVQHEKKVQRLKQTTAKIEAKQERKTTNTVQREEAKKLREKKQASRKAERIAQQAAKKQAAFEKFKLTQFRSATFAKMKLSDQLKIKEILNSKQSHEVVKDNLQKEIALIRRRNMLDAKRAKKQKTIVSGGSARNAASGAAGGGFVAGGMMANPAVMAGAAVVGGGAMLVKSGAEDYKALRQGAELTGMQYNQFARESAGFAAVSGMSQESVADKMKDINERAGQVIRGETSFDKKSGKFSGGEAEGLANLFLKKGIIKSDGSNATEVFSQSPDKLIKLAAQATVGMTTQERTSILEDFASDFSNIVQGFQQNRSGYETAKANAVQFSKQDVAAAKEFSLAMSGIASSLGQIPINVFKEFTNSLSPQTLEMLSKLGTALGQLGGIFGDVLATVLNLVSGALNPLLNVVNWLLEKIKPLTETLSEFSSQISTTMNMIQQMIKQFVSGVMDMIPDWLKPSSKPDTTTPAAPKAYNDYLTKPSLPSYTPYGAVGGGSVTNQTNITNPQNINVKLELDGEVISSRVINTLDFEDGVNRQIAASMVGIR